MNASITATCALHTRESAALWRYLTAAGTGTGDHYRANETGQTVGQVPVMRSRTYMDKRCDRMEGWRQKP